MADLSSCALRPVLGVLDERSAKGSKNESRLGGMSTSTRNAAKNKRYASP